MNRQQLAGYRIFPAIMLCLVLCTRCATPAAPTGGPKDQSPPKVVTQTPANEAVNVTGNTLKISFDEFIQLQNPRQKVLISPPPTTFPDVNIKRNELEIVFKDDLQPNTTYAIQFGDNIKDNNEGNPLSDFKWVFSTGSYLDSVIVTGKAVATDGKGLPDNTWVLLYTNLADTAFTTERPYYFSKVDKGTGNFKLDYIREGEYKVYLLEDKNGNYYYDLPTEKIGYADMSLTLTGNLVLPEINLFEPEPEEQYLADYSTSVKDNTWYLKLSKPLEINQKGSVRPLVDSLEYFSVMAKDRQTLTTWLRPPYEPTTVAWEVTVGETVLDTVYINQLQLTTKQTGISLGNKPAPGSIIPAASTELAVAQSDTLQWPLASPVVQADGKKFWLRDSAVTDTAVVVWPSADSLGLRLFTTLPAGKYQLDILPGGISYFTGDNTDTLRYTLQVLDTNTLGKLRVKWELPAGNQHIITVRNAEKQAVFSGTASAGQTDFTVDLIHLRPGKYTTEVIEDTDANGLFSKGSYAARRQPERVYTSPPIDLKAGWEQETTIKVIFGE